MGKKCYTTKHRKRREKERQSSIARKERNRKAEAEYWAKRHEREAEEAREWREKRTLVQPLVNILAKCICDLDPHYASMLRMREIFKMTSLFGVNPYPLFPILPEQEYLP